MATEKESGSFAPTMKSCRVTIGYSADDGYRSDSSYSSKRAQSPAEVMTTAADELARLAELFGFGDKVEAAVKDARQRVRDWRSGATP